MTDIENLISIIGKFKEIKRSGWIQNGVKAPESLADHSFGLVLCVFLLTPSHLDRDKCIKLAIIHDLAEIYCGDFTPKDAISPEHKHQLEKKACFRIASELANPEIETLFKEFSEGKTPEARFVRDLDRLEAVLQATYYDCHHCSPEPLLPEFLPYAAGKLCSNEGHILEILQHIQFTSNNK